MLNWTTEDLAFSCGLAAQALQRVETETPLEIINRDLSLSTAREYLIREALMWAGVSFTNEEGGNVSVSLEPWASVERPFKIQVFPVSRSEEAYPRNSFVRYGWFEPILRSFKASKARPKNLDEANFPELFPGIVNLPNEPDVYNSTNLDMNSRVDFVIRSLNHATATYRRPFYKSRYYHWFRSQRMDVKELPLTYLEIDLEEYKACDLYSFRTVWNEGHRTWELTSDPVHLCSFKEEQINSSLSNSDIMGKLLDYPHAKSFWEKNVLPIEGFFSVLCSKHT
ncbi:MAG: hypothetical protein HWE30_19270 [Methylocystaceae bacterium]|nr:hypothetical protein [Methylocystaceae bacterium]